MKKGEFVNDDKLRIINEDSEQAVAATIEKHGLYPARPYSWKKNSESDLIGDGSHNNWKLLMFESF